MDKFWVFCLDTQKNVRFPTYKVIKIIYRIYWSLKLILINGTEISTHIHQEIEFLKLLLDENMTLPKKWDISARSMLCGYTEITSLSQ